MSELSPEQVREITLMAELETRRYFDTYLKDVFPVQMRQAREHTHLMIEQHDRSTKAHGGVEAKVSRALWVMLGAAAASGAAGSAIVKLVLGL